NRFVLKMYCLPKIHKPRKSVRPIVSTMSRFERDLENELEYFPRVWLRYVDDIFVIFDTNKCNIENSIATTINNRFKSIKFIWKEKTKTVCIFATSLHRYKYTPLHC